MRISINTVMWIFIKKRAQQDDLIKGAQVKPQTEKNNVENMMEILYLYLFSVLKGLYVSFYMYKRFLMVFYCQRVNGL